MSAILKALNQLQSDSEIKNNLPCRWPQSWTAPPRHPKAIPGKPRPAYAGWPACAAAMAMAVLLAPFFFPTSRDRLITGTAPDTEKPSLQNRTPDNTAQTAQAQQPKAQAFAPPSEQSPRPALATAVESASQAYSSPTGNNANPAFEQTVAPRVGAPIKTPPGAPSAPSDKNKSKNRQDRRARLMASAQRLSDPNLNLQAIAWFDDPQRDVAVINGRMVRQGDIINGYTASCLGPQQVILVREKRLWYLEMVN